MSEHVYHIPGWVCPALTVAFVLHLAFLCWFATWYEKYYYRKRGRK